MSESPDARMLDSARRTIELEAAAIGALAGRLDERIEQAGRRILAVRGRVVVLGMGKSGHVGGKVAATLASTGTPAFFVHPAEAGHGDMGMITRDDLVLAISNSGATGEILALLPLIKVLGVPLISLTGNPQSALAQAADVHLDVGVEREACPLELAPTSSTTAAMVMGDALAIALLERRGFTAEDFAFSHPAGALGKRLLVKVADLMHAGAALPRVPLEMPVKRVLLEMTAKGLGITTVVDAQNNLKGVFTDGDLRRAIDRGVDMERACAADLMNAEPLCVRASMLAVEALGRMEERKITALVVVDERERVVGVLHLHDLLRAGVI
ncbi:MAG: KpsF/GutQ family sugar-phosphate isomerase [Cellvibrionales bacterium]|nr:KpsF/GutQ family sugar-phosphate isomerase [Cellvibrionales bacterium]